MGTLELSLTPLDEKWQPDHLQFLGQGTKVSSRCKQRHSWHRGIARHPVKLNMGLASSHRNPRNREFLFIHLSMDRCNWPCSASILCPRSCPLLLCQHKCGCQWANLHGSSSQWFMLDCRSLRLRTLSCLVRSKPIIIKMEMLLARHLAWAESALTPAQTVAIRSQIRTSEALPNRMLHVPWC